MKTYWITWSVLLVLTVAMLWADTAAFPRTAFVIFLLAAMLTKATMIGGTFMHLRAEHTGIVATVVLGLFVLGAILFGLLVPDATRIHQMMVAYGPR